MHGVKTGPNLRALRKQSKLTLRHVAHHMGISISYLCAIESGKNTCSAILESRYKKAIETPDTLPKWEKHEGVEVRDIPEYEGSYRVTSDGRVLSAGGKSNHLKEIEFKYSYDKDGYRRVVLTRTTAGKKNTKYMRVCRLVALAFIPNPSNLPMVNHIDENKANDSATNLEWTDNYGNWKHSHPNREYKVRQLSTDGEFIAEYPSLMEAMRQTGVRQGNITHCLSGKIKSTGGFKWEKM